MKTYELNSKKESGFTLVELAIVMIIIGLLIGGILKGQQLIANAKVSAAVTQLKSVDSAVSTFKDAYNAFPGDMATPTTRIPNCLVAPCSNAGTPDGRLDTVPSLVPVLTDEATAFWAQLAAADILGGIVPAGALIAGQSHPEFKIAGALRVGYSAGGIGSLNADTSAQSSSAGHYIATGDMATATGAALSLTPGQAFRVDTKIDDGQPNTGSVLAAGAATCAAAAIISPYITSSDQDLCDLYIRIQS